ncbi:unnamed protein product [Lymnaea stagnalis]|uniref:Ubiquitin carboxyl-terminal hydrolase 47 n=1 Tax=Lymnaea stagnalis TaxID=6523 RepID=A0AAV2HKZ2_LYMST
MIESRSSVVAASPLDDDKILCIIRDLVDSHGGTAGKQSLNLQASLPASQAANAIAQACGYKENTVSIHYEPQLGGEDILLEVQEADILLGTVCSSGAKRHNFTIHEFEGTMPQKLDDASVLASETKSSGNLASKPSEDFSYSYSASAKSDTGYIGLVNQAMTCYLNSLLQTLYMTPEFRNALYRWSFDGSEDEKIKSIPYQLQKLFLQLQTSKKRAVETTDLTRSFGWDSSEVWQQHDVQELCRVMFDALEQKWKNTIQANLINQLYQGKMKDYVKCLECGNESARVDAYLDIPLVIRPFGSTDSYGSVTEAMNAFVQPEILDGTNQYFCEKCNKKCNAHKGFKFVSFPYLLTLQLKRFDFDYATMHRIKLNDKITFPDVLHLNQFITNTNHGDKDSEEEEIDESKTVVSNGQVDCSDEGIDEGIEVENGCSAASSGSDSSSNSSDAAANNTRNSYYSGGKGPFVYELFSIMIHSGSAAGGHYYAYIKSFKDGQWYSFNDQQVTKITYDDIRKTYGGSSMARGFYSSAYTSSTSAYMLMYRQIDKKQNKDFMQPDDFPESLKAELRHMKEKEEAERRQREIDKSTCKIKVYCFHPLDQHKIEVRLEIHKDKTLQDATEISRELFHLQNLVPLDCCRLVKYDEYQDSLEKSFEGEELMPISTLLGGVKSNYTFDLLLETKKPDQVFIEYKPGGVTVKVFLVDIFSEIIHPPVSVRAYHVQTVGEFKDLLQKVFDLPAANMRCVLERFHNDLRPLVEPAKTLKAEGFYKSNKVFVECSGDVADNSVPYPQSRLCQLLDQHQNTIRITCSLPSVKAVQEYLATLKDTQTLSVKRASSNLVHYSKATVPVTTESFTSVGEFSQLDEGVSEHDSAFYSGATNSKHSLSGVDPGSNFSISSSTTTDTRYGAGTVTNLSQADDIAVASFDDDIENGTPRLNSDCESSSGIGEESNKTKEPVSSTSRPHSSSHEHLTVDMANVCSKLSTACLTSSRSDPSIYHTCADNSDDSLQCLGSGPSTGSQEDTSTSAEFNFSCSGPDPEPILSSPEDGYGFEDDIEDEKDVDILGAGLPPVNPRICGSGRRSGIVIHDLDLGPMNGQFHSNYNTQFPIGHFEPEEDWDREASAVTHAQTHKSLHSSPFLPHSSLGFPSAQSDTIQPNLLDTAQSALSDNPSHPLEDENDIDLSRTGTHPPPPHLFTDRNPRASTAQSGKQSSNDEQCEEDEVKRYFQAVMTECTDIEERVLTVSVDKRITLGAFKQHLQPYVGVGCNLFKVYRVYSNNQEFESVRLTDTLSFFEDGKFNIKLGRALQPGEHRVKVFQLCVTDAEPCKFLIETIFAKGMTVLESKLLVIDEIKEQCGLDIPIERCRLRKKSWTNPGTVYLDSHVYENEIPIYPNWEIFLELLEGPEELKDTCQLAIYVRHWHPSTHHIDPFREVVLRHQTVEELKTKISTLSGIPVDNVEFAKGKGTFPCEVSVLEIHTDLEWNPHVTTLNMWPLYICDDGHVIYYRDNREELIELSDEKKKEIQQKENRSSRQNHRISCSPRKERALKIYTDEDSHSSAGRAALDLE